MKFSGCFHARFQGILGGSPLNYWQWLAVSSSALPIPTKSLIILGICYWTLPGGVGKRPFLLPFRDMFRMGVRSKQSSMSNLLQNMSSKKTRMILSTCTVCTMLKWRARAKHHLRNKIQKDVDNRKIHLQTTRFSHLENAGWLIYHMPMYGNMNKQYM